MKRIHLLFSGCIFLAASGLFALYQTNYTQANPPMKKDVSMERILGYYFKQMDINGDEVITRDEREKTMNMPNMADFNDLDLNGDGQLTMSEYRKAFMGLHDNKDKDEVKI